MAPPAGAGSATGLQVPQCIARRWQPGRPGTGIVWDPGHCSLFAESRLVSEGARDYNSHKAVRRQPRVEGTGGCCPRLPACDSRRSLGLRRAQQRGEHGAGHSGAAAPCLRAGGAAAPWIAGAMAARPSSLSSRKRQVRLRGVRSGPVPRVPPPQCEGLRREAGDASLPGRHPEVVVLAYWALVVPNSDRSSNTGNY